MGCRPAGKIGGAAGEIDSRQRIVIVRERGRAVDQRPGEIGAHPIEHRHEVVAKHPHTCTPKVTNALAIILNQSIARRPPSFDVLVHRHALDYFQRHYAFLYVCAQARNPIEGPGFTYRNAEDSADDSADRRNLPDIGEGNGVAQAKPAKRDQCVRPSASRSSRYAQTRSTQKLLDFGTSDETEIARYAVLERGYRGREA